MVIGCFNKCFGLNPIFNASLGEVQHTSAPVSATASISLISSASDCFFPSLASYSRQSSEILTFKVLLTLLDLLGDLSGVALSTFNTCGDLYSGMETDME